MNVAAVIIADAMGILLLACVCVGNRYVIREEGRRNKYLRGVILLALLYCVLDIVSTLADGKNGTVVLWSNTLMYLCCPAIATTWIALIAKHLKVRLSLVHRILITTFVSVAVVLIVLNLFRPLMFRVNEYQIYERIDKFYRVYSISYFVLLLDVVVLYVHKRHESGGLKLFPMWVFSVPIVVGMAVQNLMYGVSTIAPSMTIAITCTIISFQSNLLFRDQLTDLYNRYYLSVLDKQLLKRDGKQYAVIMLDINDFKSINDQYGHDAGDEALVHLANVLVAEIDKRGEIIRYAGDEFVIVVNAHSDASIEMLLARIRQRLQQLNQTAELPYELSVSMGWSRFAEGVTLNQFVSEADERMYQQKHTYYQTRAKTAEPPLTE